MFLVLLASLQDPLRFSISRLLVGSIRTPILAVASGFGNSVSTLVDTPVCLSSRERIQLVYGFWAVLGLWCL